MLWRYVCAFRRKLPHLRLAPELRPPFLPLKEPRAPHTFEKPSALFLALLKSTRLSRVDFSNARNSAEGFSNVCGALGSFSGRNGGRSSGARRRCGNFLRNAHTYLQSIRAWNNFLELSGSIVYQYLAVIH